MSTGLQYVELVKFCLSDGRVGTISQVLDWMTRRYGCGLRILATSRVCYGVERIYLLLRREGWKDNHKRVYRIYCEEGLNLRTRRPKRNKAAAHRQPTVSASRIDECWCMDFVADQLFDGQKFRVLTIVDMYSRNCPLIYVDRSIGRSRDKM